MSATAKTVDDTTPEPGRHAFTDLYDDARHTFLIQYPVALVVALGVAGVLAFAVTGFLGYSGDSAFSRVGFHLAWPLWLWACALIITLQASIFRHPALRRQLAATLTVTILSMILVAILYFYRPPLLALLENLIQAIFRVRVALGNLITSPWTYAFINFGILAVFWADSARRWNRRAHGLPPNPRVDLGLEPASTHEPEDMPSLRELVAGDLIAGALLLLALALLFRSDVVSLIWQLFQVHVSINGCTVSWPIGACAPPGNGLGNPPTLTFIDVVLALIALPVGLIVLALAAILSGFGAVAGVGDAEFRQPAPASKDESSTEAVSEQVTETLIDTVLSALNRGGRGSNKEPSPAAGPGYLLLSLRTVLWPILIFLGVGGAAIFARDVRLYLHSDAHGLGELATYVLPALVIGALSALAILCSAALLVFHGRVIVNSLRFLGPVAFTVLLTLWIFSLALWGFNQLLLLTHATVRHPFDPPEWVTAISFLMLLIFAALLFLRRLRSPRQPLSRDVVAQNISARDRLGDGA